MYQNFTLFKSHLDLAHKYWKNLLKEGDWAIDATCGNGHDSLILGQILLPFSSWGLISLDSQETATFHTKQLLEANLPSHTRDHIHIFTQSHTTFPPLATKKRIALIVYNLGYLPGGDKQYTTQTTSTLESLEKGKEILSPGGVLSITCYPGHEEGGREEQALLHTLSTLSPSDWSVCYHTFLNKKKSPTLLLIQKKSSQ